MPSWFNSYEQFSRKNIMKPDSLPSLSPSLPPSPSLAPSPRHVVFFPGVIGGKQIIVSLNLWSTANLQGHRFVCYIKINDYLTTQGDGKIYFAWLISPKYRLLVVRTNSNLSTKETLLNYWKVPNLNIARSQSAAQISSHHLLMRQPVLAKRLF